MKRNLIGLFAIALTAIAGIAHAENIGQGSIRVTLTEADAANLKVRYLTEDGSVEKSIATDEVLKLSSFNIIDNGMDLKELQPIQNSFNLERSGTVGFIFMGDSEKLVRLSLQKDGALADLFLDFQWTPKLEVMVSPESKVEVLDDADQVMHELGEDALQITSSQGMPIHFVAPQAPDQGDDQGGVDQDDGNIDLGDGNQPASGGCSLVAASPSAFNLLAIAALGSLAAVTRLRLRK